MMKKFLPVLILLLCAPHLYAQNSTSVTVNVTDSSGQTWNNGSFQFQFVGQPNSSWPGGNLAPAIPTTPGALSGSGSATQPMPSNATITPTPSAWNLRVCPAAGISVSPSGCFTQQFTIFGNSQTLTVTPPAISIPGTTAPPVAAYADAEITAPVPQGFTYFNVVSGVNRTCSVVNAAGTCTTWIAGGGGTPSQQVNPNLSVVYITPYCGTQTNCFTSSTGDNSAVFASALAYSNSLTTTSSVIEAPHVSPQILQTATGAAVTTLTALSAVVGKDTVYVFIDDSNARTFTTTDQGGSTYTQLIGVTNSGGGGQLQTFSTAVGTAKQSDTVTISESGATEAFAMAVVDIAGASGQVLGTPVTGSSTTPSISQTTTQAGSMVLAACVWFANVASDALTSSAGTLLLNAPSTNVGNGQLGMAVWGTFAANSGTNVTSSGTLGTTSPWACQSFEVKAGGTIAAYPTIRVAQGFYNYSSGLTLTQPSNLQGEGPTGTILNYTGTGCALQVGPTGLTSSQASRPYVIQNLQFTGGASMSPGGLCFEPFVTLVGVHDVWLNDFGNSTSYMLYGTHDNWDIEIGPQVRIIVDDYTPRSIGINNASHTNNDSFWRVHDVIAACWQGPSSLGSGSAAGCTAGQSTTGFVMDSAHSRFYHNNIAFWNPDVQLQCNNSPCQGNLIEGNQFETASAAGTGTAKPPIQFAAGNGGLMVSENSVNLHSLSISFLGPIVGTDTLIGSRVSQNHINSLSAATPVVQLNNLTGQVSNLAWQNICAQAGISQTPCPLIHTAGGNINQFNADYAPKLTFAASTTASYTFGTTYGVTPACTIPPNIPGTATTLTITTLNTTTLTITASASNSATVFASCQPDAQ